MTTPRRPRDLTSGLLVQTHELSRRAGEQREISRVAEAPEGMGIDVITVPPSSPIELDLVLESVSEGVLVSGTAAVELIGECARCLEPVEDSLTVDLQELYVYPESEATEEEASRIEDDLIDLEPLIRDEVVLELPFMPLCREDCAGLCPQCGTNLNKHPDHQHEDDVDDRWAALQNWSSGDTTEPNPKN